MNVIFWLNLAAILCGCVTIVFGILTIRLNRRTRRSIERINAARARIEAPR